MGLHRCLWSLLGPLALVAACAGRNPVPTATVQPHDSTSNCTMVSAEVAANQRRISELDSESTGTTVGNVALAVVGVAIFPPLLFAMDLKNAAATERDSLSQRNIFLSSLQHERCASGMPSAGVIAASPVPSSQVVTAQTTTAPVVAAPAQSPLPVASVPTTPVAVAAMSAIQPNVTSRQTLEQYVSAARMECQRQRRRNCEVMAEAAAVEFENSWQAQSASRARLR